MVDFCSGLDIVSLELSVLETPKEKETINQIFLEYSALKESQDKENDS
ncbi:MAG: hypothetical protein ACI4PD_04105 [Butyricicoccus sp.]